MLTAKMPFTLPFALLEKQHGFLKSTSSLKPQWHSRHSIGIFFQCKDGTLDLILGHISRGSCLFIEQGAAETNVWIVVVF